MILKRERLIYKIVSNTKDIYMFTANSVVKGNGTLVMGAGNAKAVRDFYPDIDKLFGDKISHLQEFYTCFCKYDKQWIGALQTKIHYRKESPMYLVRASIDKLSRIAKERPQLVFHLPCPAISNGGKSVENILPLLENLPDNVIIYLDK